MRTIFAVGVLLIATSPVLSQTTLDRPVGQTQVHDLDTGRHDNAADTAVVVFKHEVRVPGAAWLRLHFGDVSLAGDSVVRVTARLDGEVHELDRAAMALWGRSTVYFNGSDVTIELIAGAHTVGNRVTVTGLELEMVHVETGGCSFPCGICGADDRVPSFETFAARLLPSGCSATIYSTGSCAVSAGHCMGGSMVMQFNVPASNGGCGLNHPPAADQFPVTSFDFENAGVGNDWAVMLTGTNNIGQTAFQRFGEFRPIATSAPGTGQALDIWGYGIDDQCTQSQVQQHSTGSVSSVSGLSFNHTADATCGNSGSSVIRAGQILGIASHCPCPNFATRVDANDFAVARATLCPTNDCNPPDCDDGNVCTADLCLGTTCSYSPVAGSCNDGNACTINDACFTGVCTGNLVNCSGMNTECATVSCDTGGAAGNCDVSTPINEGSPCAANNGICIQGSCVVDPGGPRVFMAPAGQEDVSGNGAVGALNLMSGDTATIEVWAADLDGQVIGSYQMALPGQAQRASGSGTTAYLDTASGSMAIDVAHPAWAFGGATDPENFFSETGLPAGFAFISTLPFGAGVGLDAPRYLGQFDVTASSDACGLFSLSFLPDGAPPNGGSGLAAPMGQEAIVAFYQPLQVTAGAAHDQCADATALHGDDLTVTFDTTCATGDGVAHSCGTLDADVWYDYRATCTGTLTVSTTTGCTFDTALAVYMDDAACTPGDSALLVCSNTPAACESANVAVTLGDRLRLRVGSIAGQRGAGTLRVTCDAVAETTRVFMTAPGGEAQVPTSGPTTMTVAAGTTAAVELWVADTAPQVMQGYQIALPGNTFAQPASHGTVTYDAGSVTVDTARPEWVFFANQPEVFLSEVGLPAGFALISAEPLGEGAAVSGLAYLGTFAVKASATATGTFSLDFLPDGAPPNGGSALIDTTGTGLIAATFQPLRITVVESQPCVTAADCGDLNNDTIVDDGCMWYACNGGTCSSIPRIFGDVGGSFGTCPIDGFANIHDKNHVLTCFAQTNPCDAINIDVGGAFGACPPDGFCNVHDANHVLVAFSGVSTCSCPAGPAPEWAPLTVGTAALRLQPRTTRVRDAKGLEVDLFIDDAIPDLLGAQFEFVPGEGLELIGLRIEQRRDALFAARPDAYSALNTATGRIMMGVDILGQPVAAGSYVATAVFEVDSRHRGPLRVTLGGEPHTALVAEGMARIAVDRVTPAVLQQAQRSTAPR